MATPMLKPGKKPQTKSGAKKSVMLSAVQPNAPLTLGSYLGAIQHWVKMQDEHECIFFAVDLHAITTPQDPKLLKDYTYRALANYIGAGIDAEKATLFIQSHVHEHSELAWVLNCFTAMGELNRMTQFKDKSAKAGKNIMAGLYTYPVLMASDILLYDTNLVPVGADQKQHVELTRDVAMRMNNRYGDDLFAVPKPYIPPVGARVMNLQEPTNKMSKSDPNPKGNIYLSDTPKEIEKKFKGAVTDSGSEVTLEDSKPGLKNLLEIQSSILGKDAKDIVASYAGKQYGHLKVETAQVVIEALKPLQAKTDQLLADKTYLDKILKKGAEKARERAQKVLSRVYDRIGFIKPT
jgi:tryptophanyl-tRNA synthetase